MTALSIIIDIALILISIVLIVTVLMQEGQRQGLGAIGGGAETFFGKNKAKSMEGKLQKYTKIAATAFIVLAIVATIVTSHNLNNPAPVAIDDAVVEEAAEETADEATDAAEEAADAVEGAAEEAADVATETTEEAASEATEATEEAAGEATEATEEAAADTAAETAEPAADSAEAETEAAADTAEEPAAEATAAN